ncbi:hypothetical protein [Oleidesulfovibrio sp.]|uniref:hypothetical protein n=1 Tax=Oleidesulfovibrio sp. TaxID=2909707 RepID=UPI003A890CAF
MNKLDTCAGCGGGELSLIDDGVFTFIKCDTCGRIGPSAQKKDDAITLWNHLGDNYFMYDGGADPAECVEHYSGAERRRNDRYAVQIDACIRLYPFTAGPVPVTVKNLSMYGAYLEIATEGFTDWSMPEGTLPYFELEISPSATGLTTVFSCNATHVSVKPPRIAIGSSFVQQDGRHLYVLRQLLKGTIVET